MNMNEISIYTWCSVRREFIFFSLGSLIEAAFIDKGTISRELQCGLFCSFTLISPLLSLMVGISSSSLCTQMSLQRSSMSGICSGDFGSSTIGSQVWIFEPDSTVLFTSEMVANIEFATTSLFLNTQELLVDMLGIIDLTTPFSDVPVRKKLALDSHSTFNVTYMSTRNNQQK